MRSNNEIEDVFNEEFFLSVSKLEAQANGFAVCVSELGLNPSSDFRHSDMSYVRLDDTDLSGFDFTGADLRGVHGNNLIWDKTTVFSNTQIDGSIFAYHDYRDKFFSENPNWHDTFKRVSGDFWTNRIMWLSKNLTGDATDRSRKIEIAKALFDAETSRVVKTDIMHYLSQAFDDKSHHRDFLLHILFNREQSVTTRESTIQVLSSFFKNDPITLRILRSVALDSGEDIRVQQKAAKAILLSKAGGSFIKEFEQNPNLWNFQTRRYYLLRKAQALGPAFVKYIYVKAKIILDFADPLNSKIIGDIAAHTLKITGDRKEDSRRRASREEEVKLRLVVLRDSGVPFIFE